MLHVYIFVLVAAGYSRTWSGTSGEDLSRTTRAEGQPLHVLLRHWRHWVTAAVEVWALPGMHGCDKRPHSEATLESLGLWYLRDDWMPCRCMSMIYIYIYLHVYLDCTPLTSSYGVRWCMEFLALHLGSPWAPFRANRQTRERYVDQWEITLLLALVNYFSRFCAELLF